MQDPLKCGRPSYRILTVEGNLFDIMPGGPDLRARIAPQNGHAYTRSLELIKCVHERVCDTFAQWIGRKLTDSSHANIAINNLN
jgi:hypothetical protein